MITTVVFTANSQAGNLARIALAARRLGYRSVKQYKLKSDKPNLDKIQIDFESDFSIRVNELAEIRTIVPTVIQIEPMETSQSAHSRTKSTKPTPQSQTATSAPSGDVKEIAGRYGKQIVAEFPNIGHLVMRLDNEVDSEVRDDVLLRLGKGIGRWRYKKAYAHGAKLPLDKTLQRLVWPALAEFVDITKGNSQVQVHNCYHGTDSQRSAALNCHFVTGFLQGFLGEMTHIKVAEIKQVAKSTQNQACVFEVR